MRQEMRGARGKAQSLPSAHAAPLPAALLRTYLQTGLRVLGQHLPSSLPKVEWVADVLDLRLG